MVAREMPGFKIGTNMDINVSEPDPEPSVGDKRFEWNKDIINRVVVKPTGAPAHHSCHLRLGVVENFCSVIVLDPELSEGLGKCGTAYYYYINCGRETSCYWHRT
jgi:hypothetical protein